MESIEPYVRHRQPLFRPSMFPLLHLNLDKITLFSLNFVMYDTGDHSATSVKDSIIDIYL
jgi:hypothetical protein